MYKFHLSSLDIQFFMLINYLIIYYKIISNQEKKLIDFIKLLISILFPA